MGEAKRRGTKEQRRTAAIKRNKDLLVRELGGRDERTDALLRTGLRPFLARMSPEEWATRRRSILQALASVTDGRELAAAKPVRVKSDEIGWYLFLCEQTLDDPLCLDISQAQRALPFFVAIGERWPFSSRVRGLDQKLDKLLTHFKSAPDGIIFEILVALSYAANGWEVELLDEKPPAKSPDMRVTKGDKVLYVECKRQDRQPDYAATERNEFLRRWDAAKNILTRNAQWIWMKGAFHREVATLPEDFLAAVFSNGLPLRSSEAVIHESDMATIRARLIDREAVHRHLERFRVKVNSPAISALLGADWAPANSAVTIMHMIKTSHVADCDVRVLGTYVDEIAWACGFTRVVDAEAAIDKKARDVTRHLAGALDQLPTDYPSIVHLAAETLEGKEVEQRRNEKVMATIPSFILDKPVLAVRFHRFQSNQSPDKLFEFDETVDKFQIDGVDLHDIPTRVVIPLAAEMQPGKHWELY